MFSLLTLKMWSSMFEKIKTWELFYCIFRILLKISIQCFIKKAWKKVLTPIFIKYFLAGLNQPHTTCIQKYFTVSLDLPFNLIWGKHGLFCKLGEVTRKRSTSGILRKSSPHKRDKITTTAPVRSPYFSRFSTCIYLMFGSVGKLCLTWLT